MFLFAHFISEAGFNPKDYPRSSGINVSYTNSKGEGKLEPFFPAPVFSKNNISFKEFKKFLEETEKNVCINNIEIALCSDSIIINQHTPKAKIFML